MPEQAPKGTYEELYVEALKREQAAIAENERLRKANQDCVAWEKACKADLDRALARVAYLESSIKSAIGWIDGDLRDIIRDVGNQICSYNDLYESADRIEELLAQAFRGQPDQLENTHD